MKLGLMLGYSGKTIDLPMDGILAAERLGFDSAWVAEAWGSDAVSVASWVLARTERLRVGTGIMQIPARTPAMAAMTAMTLSQLSGGRFILGVGASGAQVAEGWHGQPYENPLQRMREYIEIVRLIMARQAPLAYDGDIFQLPYQGPGSTGLGKPLKSILQADTSIPVFTASFTPAGFRLGGELADGVIPAFLSPGKMEFLVDNVHKGMDKAGRPHDSADFEIAPFVHFSLGEDIEACRESTRQMLALYVGGMGAKTKNYYNNFARRIGYGDAAAEVQELYLSGRKREAARAVPAELIDEISLVGSADRIREHAKPWLAARDAGNIQTMILRVDNAEAMALAADIFLS
jgi:F420-dependent oxidoreductase-like protein